MKKFLFWATVVGTSLTGCVNDVETVLSPEDNPQQITFEVGKYKPSSRAEITFPVDTTFGAFAFQEKLGVPGHQIFMDNVEISYKRAATPYWSPRGKDYYWPTQGHLDFICYFPHEEYTLDSNGNETVSAVVPKLSNDLNTLSYYNYTVNADEPDDLLYSDKAVKYTSNSIFHNFAGVPVLFHHALAKLAFRVRAQRLNNSASSSEVTNWTIKLNSVKISGIYSSGSVSLTVPEYTETSPTRLQWSVSGDKQVWTPNGTQVEKTWTPTGGQYLLADSERKGALLKDGENSEAKDYYVLPQTLDPNAQTITISYTVTTVHPEGNSDVKDYTTTKKFTEFPSVTAWEMGKYITYVIEIDPAGDIINFAPAVEDWVTAGNGTGGYIAI